MTKPEFEEMAALVVLLRKQVEIEQARATHESRERHALVLQLSAHVDALKQSNAQCSKLLVQNEQLTAELDRMKGDPLPIKLVGKLKDVETSNKTLHSELVEVRAALATVSEERDSLKRTLQEWEEAETKPHARVAADDIADHVVPPVLPLCGICHGCGSKLGAWGPGLRCHNQLCNRTATGALCLELSPFHGPCNSPHQVRHE